MARILIVEDEALVALQVSSDIASAGHRVVGISCSSEHALDILRTEPVDIVLMDIVIQGDLNGIELTKLINDLHSECRVIFMTAHTDKSTVKDANATRYDGMLNKPFTEDELLAMIGPAD